MADYRLAPVHHGRAHWDTATPVDAPPRLTPLQHAILDAVRAYVAAYGYPPTLREIADAVGLSATSTVAYQLGRLEDKGALLRDAHLIRGLHLRDHPPGQHGELYLVPGGAP